jgi:hypothetical protein
MAVLRVGVDVTVTAHYPPGGPGALPSRLIPATARQFRTPANRHESARDWHITVALYTADRYRIASGSIVHWSYYTIRTRANDRDASIAAKVLGPRHRSYPGLTLSTVTPYEFNTVGVFTARISNRFAYATHLLLSAPPHEALRLADEFTATTDPALTRAATDYLMAAVN